MASEGKASGEEAVETEASGEKAVEESKDAPKEEDAGEWYYQESSTQQPAGPWTVAQLRTRWHRQQINGLTPVWRVGLEGGWRPLAEVSELKDALREGSEAAEGGEEQPPAKRLRRTPLDEIPLTHTYTSEQGLLYVYDTVDEDWKASDVYEGLLKSEESEVSAEKAAESSAPASKAAEGGEATGGMSAEEQEEALRELLAEAAKGPSLGAGPMAPALKDPKRRAAAEVAAENAAAAAKAQEEAGGAAPEALDPEKEAKRQKRKEYRERKKLKQQAGLFVKAKENPNVYVSGLPPDVTLQELEPLFKRAGVLKVDVDTCSSKIRIYCGQDGQCKGDALVSYANAASVDLAIKFLHEYEIRAGCRICVQQADFEDTDTKKPKLSKTELKELAATRKPEVDRAKYLAAKNVQKEAVSWSSEMDDGTGRRIVVLRHMFSLEEAEKEGPEFYTELAEEVQEECEKVGQVVRVTPIESHLQGIVCVKFKNSWEAEECIRVMDGRYFAGRTVEAAFYDGKTDLKALGIRTEPKAVPLRPGPATSADTPQPDEVAGSTAPEEAASDAAVAEAPPAVAAEEAAEVEKAYNAMFEDQSSDDEDLVVRTE